MGSDGTLWIVLRTLLALPVVLAAAYLSIRFMLGRKSLRPGVRRMRLVESLPLSAKGVLVLVELGGRYYFLACQEGAVALIKEMEELPAPLSPGTGPDLFDLGAAIPKISALWRKADFNNRVKAWKNDPR
ncbi:MAG: flagellar biosynthetic protein FliO [Peptococcaceae bacterium]|jgi:flagellar biogenesis protein FliO|nr:flagellar biosynthetic protein FliO [Peptococcaceae bacterium]